MTAAAVVSPYRAAAEREPERVTRVTRIEHKLWWFDGEIRPGVCVMEPHWVPFQTYRYASHGCWTVPTEPWVLVEEQPW